MRICDDAEAEAVWYYLCVSSDNDGFGAVPVLDLLGLPHYLDGYIILVAGLCCVAALRFCGH